MKQKTSKIGTWPTPEKPVSFEIPIEILLKGGLTKVKVALFAGVVGIHLPWSFMKRLCKHPTIWRLLVQKFDVLLIAK